MTELCRLIARNLEKCRNSAGRGPGGPGEGFLPPKRGGNPRQDVLPGVSGSEKRMESGCGIRVGCWLPTPTEDPIAFFI